MEKKITIGITIFGILEIIWGILLAFETATSLVRYYSFISKFSSDFGFPLDKFIVIVLYPLLYAIIFLLAGIGVLRLKPWGHQLSLLIGSLLLFLTEINFLIWGFFLEKHRILLDIILGGLILWLFNRDEIKKIFALSENYLRKEKRAYFIAIIVAVLVGLGYLYFVKFYLMPSNPSLFSEPHKIDYAVEDKERLLGDYKERQFLNYNIYIPSNFRLRRFSYDDNFNGVNMVIANPNKTSFLLFTNKPIFELMFLTFREVLDIDNSYEFGKRFIHEKVSVIFLALKNLSTSRVGRFAEVYFENGKGFLQRWRRKDKGVYDYTIWYKGSKKSLGLTFIFEGETLSKDEIRDIVSSLTLGSSQRTAEEYFQEGLSLFNQNKYEEAKFSFVNAICQDRQNPQYSYYLGYAFFETEDWNAARKHLNKAISLQPDYTDAQKLLDEIEDKEKTKE